MIRPTFRRFSVLCAISFLSSLGFAADARKFDFGSGPASPGFTRVEPSTVYSESQGYGFEPGATVTVSDGCCTSDKPFYFSVALPEGNYNVTVTLGDDKLASVTTIKAEARRLMLEKVETAAGKPVTRTFTVNVRTPKIASGGDVSINSREKGPPLAANWDEKLTLEFNNTHPSLRALEVTKADDAITIYLAGDSTVTDQAREPWSGWGQMLPVFFKPGLAIANHAESGLALFSFKGQKRLNKIMSTLKHGDYVFIQFGHNDQKDKRPGAGAFTTYKDSLKEFIAETKKREGIPVLITSMNRRRFDANGKVEPTLGDFPEAVRQTAKEENVLLIDLNAMSTDLYEALGRDGSRKAFVHYPAGSFPGQDKDLKDDTHFNNYGGYELAKCIVEGIRQNIPGLAKYVVDNLPAFDPKHPDPVDTFKLPPSPSVAPAEKPAGS